MTTPSHSNQYHPDWLDALSILRRAVDGADITKLWSYHLIEFDEERGGMLLVQHGETLDTPNGTMRRLHIGYTEEEFAVLPKIERVEILTYAACVAWGEGWPIDSLCQRAGCYWKNTQSIRERWRLIDYYQPAHLLPNACFEDRSKCKVCVQPVATGAGALVNCSTALQPDGLKYHSDIHEECLRFAHRVMVPLVKGEAK